MKAKIQKIFLFIFPFVLPLPLGQIIPPFCLVLFMIGLLMGPKFSIRYVKSDKFFLLCALFFFADLIGNILRLSFNTATFRDIKLSFLIIPLIFIAHNDVIKKHVVLICNAFVFGTLSYILYSWGYIADFYLITAPNYKEFSLSDGYIVYQLYNYLPGAIHHTYIGIYIVFSIMILLHQVKTNKTRRHLKLLLIAIHCFSLFYIGSKISFFLLFLLVTIYLISLRKFIINIGFTLCFFVGLYLVKRWVVGMRLENSIYARLDYYSCGLDILEKNWFAGIGADNFSEISSFICNNEIFIPHNIFLRAFVTNGFLGFTILILLIGLLMIKAFKAKDLIFISLVLMLLIAGMTEDLIYRQRGVLFFVFFVSLFYIKNLKHHLKVSNK